MFIFEILFWMALILTIYTYFGYPVVLFLLVKIKSKDLSRSNSENDKIYTVSILMPVHNEESVIKDKLINLNSLNYPKDKLQIIIISDGSTDATNKIVDENKFSGIKLLELPERSGKTEALNRGLKEATNEILVFIDASIMLEPDSLMNLLLNFKNKKIGCISGSDQINESGGEGIYGKYELILRELESKVYSIVGASGSFYAQRTELCQPFIEGLAPDFLSVLNTVEKGFITISEPSAKGFMKSVKDNRDEFNRKIRTLIRGMTALFYKKNLLNPFKYFLFSFELVSHKLMRWLVPIFLILMFLSNLILINRDNIYRFIFIIQIFGYVLAGLSHLRFLNIHKSIVGKIPLYFIMVNTSILFAWFKYLSGERQELWNPSKR